MAQAPTIVFLNLPPKTFIGIDLSSFNSAPNFHGIRNLPNGLHFVYTGTDASLSIRHGIWLNLRANPAEPQLIVLKWKPEIESLEEVLESSDEAQTVSRRLPDLHRRGLIDYTALREASANLQREQSQSTARDDEEEDVNNDTDESIGLWPALTTYITRRLLTRILSSSGSNVSWSLTSISSCPSDTEHIPGLSSNESSSTLSPHQILHLLPIDLKQTWPDTATGRDRTNMARDRSWYFGHLVDTLTTPTVHAGKGRGYGDSSAISQAAAAKELLGEVQFCFLMVLCLANYSCLEQWKRVLGVLLTCRNALVDAERVFVEVLRILRVQLGRVDDVEGGLFDLGDEMGSAWMRKLLKRFRGLVDEAFGDTGEAESVGEKEGESGLAGEELKSALSDLEKWLKDKYGWEDEKNVLRKGMVQLEDGEMVEIQADELDEEEETGEYAPVIVETGTAYSATLD